MDRKGTHLGVSYPKYSYIKDFLRNSLCPIWRRTALQMHKNRMTISGTQIHEKKDMIGSSDTRMRLQWTHLIQHRRREIEHHGNQPANRPATLRTRQDESNSSPPTWLRTTQRTYLKISIFTNMSGDRRIKSCLDNVTWTRAAELSF